MALVAIGLGLVLFVALDARRRTLSAPAVHPRTGEALSTPSEIAPLFIPPAPEPAPVLALPSPVPSPVLPSLPAVRPQPPVYSPPAYQTPPPAQEQPAPARAAGEPALVIDSTSGNSGRRPPADGEPAAKPGVSGTRTGVGVLANRATTVPQGTLIPAVLETALDSTSPGLARALVSRDIRGFDGSRVLIPRGSRLIGEFGADTQNGQKRMLVNWTRLIRPDGVTIAINSPATDPLGQGGIKASVNSHFFARFAGAILQSALNVGVNLASRAADSSVIVALPNMGTSATPPQNSNDIRPTLKVKAAASISIFVARDLDFTGVEDRE
ncbi:TrbI/VirB10 family protein [Sphingomonas sp. R-74633]|uniref:TrbI/VirB10 family protein n=1 Tax=Sphingomonas sp. R-74633 TaxID=2751188 RepID=UPI0015D2602E|nr:TrbI/VirB10 family protein [Sphingomonas sp. R-74633]NYT40680.1 TrbI/VirB10 family protein [Sphingomonas sp. R-74633]